MPEHTVFFKNENSKVTVPTGVLLTEAASLAQIELNQPCGGQGRCGRCIVQVTEGEVRRRSNLRLSKNDIQNGYALACQTIIEGDIEVVVPKQEEIVRRLTTDKTVVEISIPKGYDHKVDQSIIRVGLTLPPPSMDDQTDDLSRLRVAIRKNCNIDNLIISLNLIRKIGEILRENNWKVTAIIDKRSGDDGREENVLVDVVKGHVNENEPLWGAAIDIGTTTVTLWLIDLITGKVYSQVSEYNGQIARGEDVISRVVYAKKAGGQEELRHLILETIHKLLEIACKRIRGFIVTPEDIVKVTVAGNSIMLHLFLGIPAENIRLSPFITAVNNFPTFTDKEVEIGINHNGSIYCLPCVASYVGADITAGVYAAGLENSEEISLFMDVGTNGEIVLGSKGWLVACACSAGPAFEGAGVVDGMRATKGAIEEIWINGENYEPSYRTIGSGKPSGICGSGLISLLAELFITGLIDKGGNFNPNLGTERIRNGEHGLEYVVVWGEETQTNEDIVITSVDIDNLIRAKGAIFAGYQVLANSVGINLDMIQKMLIGGSFGKYINVEKAIQIGLLPDMPWEKFQFLGNTSVQGAYQALLGKEAKKQIDEIAQKMTYIELSADNSFYEAFMSALFLPHTDYSLFPSVVEVLNSNRSELI
jgi:uncharacterized 2Fe-2S/4Fe-4S cluster protein (DUF4445 family)